MGDLVDSIGGILSRVEWRVETAAQNIANVTTPGYRRAISFETMLTPRLTGTDADNPGSSAPSATRGLALDLTPGPLQTTGTPTDLAIAGDGFFSVRAPDGAVFYTRQGQFHRDEMGRLVNAQHCVLQQAGGGDLVLKPMDFKVLDDGTVLQDGDAVGRIAVLAMSRPDELRVAEGGLYAAPEGDAVVVETPEIRQGALEASNVSLGAEMTSMMAALREAQAGQRLMNVYDDLIGRAVTTFGQG